MEGGVGLIQMQGLADAPTLRYMGLRQADLLLRQDLDGRPPKQSSILKRGEHYEK